MPDLSTLTLEQFANLTVVQFGSMEVPVNTDPAGFMRRSRVVGVVIRRAVSPSSVMRRARSEPLPLRAH